MKPLWAMCIPSSSAGLSFKKRVQLIFSFRIQNILERAEPDPSRVKILRKCGTSSSAPSVWAERVIKHRRWVSSETALLTDVFIWERGSQHVVSILAILSYHCKVCGEKRPFVEDSVNDLTIKISRLGWVFSVFWVCFFGLMEKDIASFAAPYICNDFVLDKSLWPI